MRKLLAFFAVVGFATTVMGADFSMNFVGGVGGPDLGDTITLAPSDIAYIEIWLNLTPADQAEGYLTGSVSLDRTGDGGFTWDSYIPGDDSRLFYSTNFGTLAPPRDLGDASVAAGVDLGNYQVMPVAPASILLATLDIHCAFAPSMDTITFASSPPPTAKKWEGGDYSSGAATAIGQLTVNQVPEPASLALLALGGLALIRRR